MALTSDGAGAPIRADYPEPLWIQAANIIRGQIASGILQPGSRLAPERDLCIQFGISRVTLRKALASLVAEGVLSASHGRGWYVSKSVKATSTEWPSSLESFTETARRLGLTPTSTVLHAGVGAASLDEAETLLVAPGTPLFRLERVRLLDGVPIAVDATQVPAAQLGDVDGIDFTTASLYELLASRGVEPVRADATIEAREATAAEAGPLAVEVGKPVLVMRQLAFDGLDRPLFDSVIHYAGDRYRLKTSFARAIGAPRSAVRDDAKIVRPKG